MSVDVGYILPYSSTLKIIDDIDKKIKYRTLKTGIFQVGRDIPPGKYIISVIQPDVYGSIIIKSKKIFIYETIGTKRNFINNIQVKIQEGDEIQISGLDEILFIEKDFDYGVRKNKNITLGCGIFQVGEDIPPGKYIVYSSENCTEGNIFISGKRIFTKCTLKSVRNYMNNVHIVLNKNDIIKISGINEVVFIKK